MIDLADIRKKAREQKDSAAGETPAQGVATTANPAQKSVQGVPAGAALTPVKLREENSIVPAQAEADPLERLFSEHSGLQLANEEIYFQGLRGKHDQETENRLEWLTFSLGSEDYAVDIGSVAEIIKPREITEIPRVPAYVLGIMSLRGVIVPIFDLKRRLRLGVGEQTANSRIIICQSEDATAGLLVDGINQVVRIAQSNIEPPPSLLPDIDVDLVEGVGRHQGSFLILLNLDGIFNAGVSIRQ